MPWTAILGILNKILGWLPIIGAFVAGRRHAQAQQTEAALDAAKTRATVEDEVRRLDPTAVADSLQRDWKRR